MFTLIIVLASVIARAFPFPTNNEHGHSHSFDARLPDSWYHHSSHPAHSLFARQHEDVLLGSPAWVASFPATPADVAKLPKAWEDALAIAVANDLIPDIPITEDTGGSPLYPDDVEPSGAEVCSATYKCRHPEDIWDAPDGVFAVSFDDGPLPYSDKLYDFLESKDVHATHFMIGLNILRNTGQFDRAFRVLEDDIAVHTWTHPHMTTLSNEQIVGELGYTIKVIYDLTGGRLPRYWRPPYGDSDNRVRAIAHAVFGLDTVIWNRDSDDWTLASNQTTLEAIHLQMEEWFLGPKSPGLMILEHELSDLTVQAFIDALPIAQEAGWQTLPLSECLNASIYRNAADNTGKVLPVPFVVPTGIPPPRPSTSSTSSTSSSSASSTRTVNLAVTTTANIVSSSIRTTLTSARASASPGIAQTNSNAGPAAYPISLVLSLAFSGIITLLPSLV